MNYRKGLSNLKPLFKNTSFEQDFLIYEARLLENIYREESFGSTDQTRSTEKELVLHLNRIASYIYKNFEEECR